MAKSSLGMEENIAGLLCYVLGFITGIVFLLLEKENTFVRFHAIQSIITFGGFFIVNLFLSLIPFLGWVLGLLVSLLSIVVWIICMIKAYQGEMFKLPVIGEIAAKQAHQ